MLKKGSVLINKYLIEEIINDGGTSIVYKARHNTLKVAVAIKKITVSNNLMFDYRHEVDILKRLRHTMLPRIYDVIQYGQEIYIVMDYIDGESLEQLLVRTKGLSEQEAIALILELTQVVAYIHSNNIVHSDIKPANIMVTKTGQIKLIDFGIAHQAGDSKKQWGRSLGFSAPEQLNRQEVDYRSDIYSLAATLYYCITGQLFTPGQSVNTESSDISEKLGYLLNQALQSRSSKRHQHIQQFSNQLHRVSSQTDCSFFSLKKLPVLMCLVFALIAYGCFSQIEEHIGVTGLIINTLFLIVYLHGLIKKNYGSAVNSSVFSKYYTTKKESAESEVTAFDDPNQTEIIR